MKQTVDTKIFLWWATHSVTHNIHVTLLIMKQKRIPTTLEHSNIFTLHSNRPLLTMSHSHFSDLPICLNLQGFPIWSGTVCKMILEILFNLHTSKLLLQYARFVTVGHIRNQNNDWLYTIKYHLSWFSKEFQWLAYTCNFFVCFMLNILFGLQEKMSFTSAIFCCLWVDLVSVSAMWHDHFYRFIHFICFSCH